MNSKLDFDFSTTQTVIQKIGRIDGFKSRWEAVIQEKSIYVRELRQHAETENIRAAVAIAGGQMTHSEAEWILRALQKEEKRTRNKAASAETGSPALRLETLEEQNAAGWQEAAGIVFRQYKSLHINLENIKTLHDQLLQFDPQQRSGRGHFRTKVAPLRGQYADGSDKQLFDTTTPSKIEKELKALIDWTAAALEQKAIHPLLIIGAFHFAWLSVAPFQTGNMRMGFLLTQLLLLQNGYESTAAANWLWHLSEDRVGYFKALRNSHPAHNKAPHHVGPWMICFLETLEIALLRVEEQYRKWQTPGIYLSDRQKKVREYIGRHQPVKAGDLQKALPDILVSNLRKDLQYLVSIKQIEKIGHLKSTIYIAKE